jgi:molybdopterin converting factor small subunit
MAIIASEAKNETPGAGFFENAFGTAKHRLVRPGMTVTVRLFGELKQHMPPGQTGRVARLELPEDTTALQLILRLGIPYGGDEGQMVVAVNDVEVDHNTVLREGDSVSLFAPLAGG